MTKPEDLTRALSVLRETFVDSNPRSGKFSRFAKLVGRLQVSTWLDRSRIKEESIETVQWWVDTEFVTAGSWTDLKLVLPALTSLLSYGIDPDPVGLGRGLGSIGRHLIRDPSLFNRSEWSAYTCWVEAWVWNGFHSLDAVERVWNFDDLFHTTVLSGLPIARFHAVLLTAVDDPRVGASVFARLARMVAVHVETESGAPFLDLYHTYELTSGERAGLARLFREERLRELARLGINDAGRDEAEGDRHLRLDCEQFLAFSSAVDVSSFSCSVHRLKPKDDDPT